MSTGFRHHWASCLLALIMFVCRSWGARPDTVLVIDTVAPVIRVDPVNRYHSKPFLISLHADKRATIHYSIGSFSDPVPYRKPIDILRDGTYTLYYQAEDDYGNTSALDSSVFVLDSRPPLLQVTPDSGIYPHPVLVRITVNEPSRLVFKPDPDRMRGRHLLVDSLLVSDSLYGIIEAIDSAGNTATARLRYRVDTTRVSVVVDPEGGTFNTTTQKATLSATHPAEIFYTFDPLAPPDWFHPYTGPVSLPYGVSALRYFARSPSGLTSKPSQTVFVVDTIPPRLQVVHRRGSQDTLILTANEPSTIWYSLSDAVPLENVRSYKQPIIVPAKNRVIIRAIAQDQAGNRSELIRWEHRYDTIAPTVRATPAGGTFTSEVAVVLASSKEGRIFYTLDGSEPSERSVLYTGPVTLSKDATTTLRFFAVDMAGNSSTVETQVYALDLKKPVVRARVEQVLGRDHYRITLSCDKRATVHFELGGAVPGPSSPVYTEPLTVKKGEVLKYLAIDNSGNRSDIGTLEDIDRPLVSLTPGPGVFKRRPSLRFETNVPAEVFWRSAPDTLFRPFVHPIVLDREGVHTIEYYARTQQGTETPLRRDEYLVDMTPPQVDVHLKRGTDDSISVFLECNEPATIYYTLDGTSPLFSARARVLGKSRPQTGYRISLARSGSMQLAFVAEDIAGNEGALTYYDLSRPRVIPSIPPGPDRLHDRFLSVALSTLDPGAQIYFNRQGRVPTTDSSRYREPIVVLSSDTILAFVVDAAGTIGTVDTFVYRIDIPPSPRLTYSPSRPQQGDRVVLDASGSIDQETPRERLKFRWDFSGDGVWDTEFASVSKQEHIYPRGGIYRPVVQVRDEAGRSAQLSVEIRVLEICPAEMVFVAMENDRSFCIDRFEHPGRAGKAPAVNVSWVEANVTCATLGKRLCTATEWSTACQGGILSAYPYGHQYIPTRCPSEGKAVHRSGSFKDCSGSYGAQDMIGNVWEWIEDKEGDYPLLAGGSYRHGKNAHCGLRSTATVATRSGDIGFRCCR